MMTTPTHEINQYITEIDKIYRSGKGTEHSYRPALKAFLEAITSGLTITNEPKRIACGAPDYIITKGDIPVGCIEAKDIPVGIHNKLNKEQFDRYKQSLNNLIITNYLTFELFVDGLQVFSVSIAQEKSGTIQADKKQYLAFAELMAVFTGFQGKTIYQSEQLARMMAGKAKLLAAIIEQALKEKKVENDSLSGQLEAFRKILIHDLGPAAFADIYAQTLAYGLFAARMNDHSADTFNRGKAAALIPQSNPFLRKFFHYIAGLDLDDRIRWIVDALADLFNWVAVEELLKEFGKANQDPFIHFYETFLAEYDPRLRESRGVYYTPLPVVKFIVQAVDDILQKEFNLSKGLADNSKIKRTIKEMDGTKRQVEFHKVQILDPAAGTGTFLAEVIDKIFSRFSRQKGLWAGYCAEHLIPRLNGFEILMASYAMAHFKLDMKLQETGYQEVNNSRLRVYLTNSLEEAEDSIPVLLMEKWLSDEAVEASNIKRNTPVMVVLGNPPYSVSSQNKGEWIQDLLTEYKKELHERKTNLDDDYIKFIRYGQYFVEKNGIGVLAYISNNSFIDGVTHRQMRKSLLECFDTIYIIDLHGSSKKKETTPEGGKDENVFDIQQGVSINIFIKSDKKETGKKGCVYHHDLYGLRKEKYYMLERGGLSDIKWTDLSPSDPYYFFVPKNFSMQDEYDRGFSITELFQIYNSGIKTDRDSLFVDMDKGILSERIRLLLSNNFDTVFRDTYNINDSSSYKLTRVIKGKIYSEKNIKTVVYRPFDNRNIYYDNGLTSRPAYNVMKHFLQKNVSLITVRQQSTFPFQHVLISKNISDICTISSQTKETAYVFPLYLYPNSDELDNTAQRQPNLNIKIVAEIAKEINLRFTVEKEETKNSFAPIDILDYIYAILHSPAYREKYREFLKIDFPRVPYPENAEQFTALAALGANLRGIHLLETVNYSGNLAEYPIEGNNTVDKPEYRDAKVWINKKQYFDKVPPEAWDFYIGGYQPAQKWLKDRKSRSLTYDEIEHYQKILIALHLTIEIQARIDEVIG